MNRLKSEITKTATALFIKHGLRSVSIDDISKQLQISKKTFYLYFTQKEELIEQALLQHHDKTHKKNVDAWFSQTNKNIIDLLMEFAKEAKTEMASKKKQFAIYYDLEKYYPKIFSKHCEKNKKESLEFTKKIIQRGIDEKLFRKDIIIEIVAQFLSIQFQSIMEIQRNRKKITFQQLFDEMMDITMRILCNENGFHYFLENYKKA